MCTTACTVLLNPLGSEGAVLDLAQDLLHLLAGLLGDDALAGAVVAVLSGIGDGVTHLGKAALVDQVNDQLHLVNALEVSVLRSVASLDQSLKASLHQLADAAAEDSLLAEQVGLGLGLEGGLEDAGTAAADAAGICQSDVHSLAGSVLLNADQIRNAVTLEVLGTNGVARALRSDHDNVDVSRRNDLLEVDVEAVSESQNIARLQVRLDNVLVDVSLLLIRGQHHDDVAGSSSLSRSHDLQTVVLSLLLVLGARTQTNDNMYAGVLQVHCVSMTLGAEADDSNGLAVEQRQVAVCIIEHFYHCYYLLNVWKVNWVNKFINRRPEPSIKRNEIICGSR